MDAEHRATTRTEPPDRPSLRVVETVAAVEGVDPASLEPPLHAVIDPEALDRPFAPTADGTRRGTVPFSYRGHDATVRSGGTVEID